MSSSNWCGCLPARFAGRAAAFAFRSFDARPRQGRRARRGRGVMLRRFMSRLGRPMVALRRTARHRSPPVRRRIVAPDFRPLRPVLMPGPRLEEAKVFVMHLIEIGEELDDDAVGILV